MEALKPEKAKIVATLEKRTGPHRWGTCGEIADEILTALSLGDGEGSTLDGKLEPEAKHGMSSRSEAALVSAAISPKRIADTIDGTASGLCVTETLLGGRRLSQGA